MRLSKDFEKWGFLCFGLFSIKNHFYCTKNLVGGSLDHGEQNKKSQQFSPITHNVDATGKFSSSFCGGHTKNVQAPHAPLIATF